MINDFSNMLKQIAKSIKGTQDKYYNNDLEDLKNSYRNYMAYLSSDNDIVDTPDWHRLARRIEKLLKSIYTGQSLSKEDLESSVQLSDDINKFADNIVVQETDTDNDGDIDRVEVIKKEDEDYCPQCNVHTINGTCPKCHLNVPLSKKFTKLLFKPVMGGDGMYSW